MKDFAFLGSMLILAVIGLTFTCHLVAGDEDNTSTRTLLPEAEPSMTEGTE